MAKVAAVAVTVTQFMEDVKVLKNIYHLIAQSDLNMIQSSLGSACLTISNDINIKKTCFL